MATVVKICPLFKECLEVAAEVAPLRIVPDKLVLSKLPVLLLRPFDALCQVK
jgi:hypothetical protein